MLILVAFVSLCTSTQSDEAVASHILRLADNAKAYRSDWAARELSAAQFKSCETLSVVNSAHKSSFSANLARLRNHVERLVSSISPVTQYPVDIKEYMTSLDGRLAQVDAELAKSKTAFLASAAASQKDAEDIIKQGVMPDASSKAIESNDFMQEALRIFLRGQQLKLVKKAVENLKTVIANGSSLFKFLEKPETCKVSGVPAAVKDPLGISEAGSYSLLDVSEKLTAKQVHLEIALSVRRQEEHYQITLLKHVSAVEKELASFNTQLDGALAEMHASLSKLLVALENALRDSQGLSAGARHDLILLTRLNERKSDTAFREDKLFLGDCAVSGGQLIDGLLKCL